MPVIVNGNYYSDGERCSHCGRPFFPKFANKGTPPSSICRSCRRLHMNSRDDRFRFIATCRHCVSTIPEEHAFGDL